MTAGHRAEDLRELRRRCVECGLCLPTCATWAATGNEVLSPRGRLLLMEDLLDGAGAAGDPAALASFDQCIGCRACETACPSGVPFTLFEQGKRWAATRRRSGDLPVTSSPVPGWLQDRLDRPQVLRLMKQAAPLARLAPAPLARLTRFMPAAPDRDEDLVRLLETLCGGVQQAGTSAGEVRENPVRTVAFFSGCANAGLMPATSRRFITLLRRNGCAVTIPAGQGCCGALAGHTGRERDRERLEDANRKAFRTGKSVDWLVVEAAGCGAALKADLAGAGHEILDATEALARLDLHPLRAMPLRVAYHAACHLEHGQRITEQPRRLLRAIPELELVEPEDAALCCGSGGVWSLQNPALAAEIGRHKAAALAATGADLIVTTNPGCLGQIRGSLADIGLDIPILPLTDLIWYVGLNG